MLLKEREKAGKGKQRAGLITVFRAQQVSNLSLLKKKQYVSSMNVNLRKINLVYHIVCFK